jgi:peptidoglycan hydrolase-like protein with peptidoglycan-binding domain
MKIIITESQFKKISKIIKENDVDRKALFEKFVKVYVDLTNKGKEITKDSTNKEIKIMQIVLRILTQKEIELNGILDENTQSVLKTFQSENNLKQSGYFDTPTIKKLTEKFLPKYKSENLDLEKDNTQISKPSLSDDDFYKKILTGIGAPITTENMKFMYAWRQGESAKAAFNPFNTTRKKENTTFYNCLKRKNNTCVAGVRNYNSQQEGIDATVSTLNQNYYTCITDGLKNNIGAKKIATQCQQALKTWGTGGLVAKVLSGSKLSPPPIPNSTTKTVS